MAMQRDAGMMARPTGANQYVDRVETKPDAPITLAEAGIDENLCRAELSPSDRAKQTARRKAIYLELHPETAHGANLEGAGVANLSTPETPAFATATANITGQSERAVRRDAERGEKVIDAYDGRRAGSLRSLAIVVFPGTAIRVDIETAPRKEAFD